MPTQWINVFVTRKNDPDGGGLLDQLKPPFPTQEHAIIFVKGKNYRVVRVSGNLHDGPGEVHVTDE